MTHFDRKKHWENVYQSKRLEEVSWFQPVPEPSLSFIRQFNLPRDARIIDIGGGDGLLVDHLLDLGYQDITVVDISATALDRAKRRLGKYADKVTWIEADVIGFRSETKYDFWHDRATFHFLTSDEDSVSYFDTATNLINKNGILVVGTFSEDGPKKCSGIEIKQYSEKRMNECFAKCFQKITCVTSAHKTPSATVQNFIFCSFKKL